MRLNAEYEVLCRVLGSPHAEIYPFRHVLALDPSNSWKYVVAANSIYYRAFCW